MARTKKTIAPGVAYGYIRASTEDQETTLEAQKTGILSFFEYKLKPAGYTMGPIFVDSGISGSIPLAQREYGHRLCTALQNGDAVVMQKIDRGWRNLGDFCNVLKNWRQKGIRLAFTEMDIDTASMSGDLMIKLLAVLSEFERCMIGERMRHFVAQRKREGRPHSPLAPYGFKIVGPKGRREYAECPESRAVGKLLLKWKMGGWTLNEITRHARKVNLVIPSTGRTPSLVTVHNYIKGEIALQLKEKSHEVSALEGDGNQNAIGES